MISTPALKTAVHGAPSAEQAGLTLDAGAEGARPRRAARDGRASRSPPRRPTLGFGPWGAVDGKVLPDQLVERVRPGRAGARAAAGRLQQGEIRSLTVARAAGARERGRVREHDPRALRRSRRRVPAALSGRAICRRASSRRRATRSTAGPPSGWCASRPRWACRPISICGTTAIRRPTQAGLHAFHASELPYVFGTFDGTPPLWPKNPRHARGGRARRRDGRLLDELRAHRPSAGDERARLAGVCARRRATCTSPRRRRPRAT